MQDAAELTETMPFETALEHLENIVENLESGTLSLDETMALYQRGRALAKHCQGLLDDAALQVKQLLSDGEGGQNVVPLDVA